MKITFDHVSLRAKNLESMKDFLVELLGLEIGARPNFPFPGYWLYTEGTENALIHIYDEDASFYKKDLIKEDFKEESSGKNIVNHICFSSDNYEEIMERIAKLNTDYSINLVPNSPIEQIFIKAPENLIIEIQAIPKDKKKQ
ncbi:hypothetical protein [Poseidonibacter lekithochrous]|uniref:hypothetical protein n=1 Tax=Poseidonibacter lekithochrous TaxID=1904463 RepID=UPI0008FCDFB1|nr:hypothetical protein [Poseidonibacter lekithochrous]QKJ23643.1 vicinal oxygen chelate (VOC) family protein [Poseidonibacter lekithochrous]